MPRPERKRLPGGADRSIARPVTTEASELTQVVAAPTGGYYDSGPSDLQRFGAALSAFNPKIQELLQGDIQDQARSEATKMINLGRAGHAKGMSPDAKPELWVDGYMQMDGYKRAQEDGAAFAKSYETEFDKESGDFDAWSKQWWQARTKGVSSDNAFLTGYSKNITEAVNAVRAEHLKYNATQTIDRQNANTMSFLDGEFKKRVDKGEAITAADVDRVRQDLRDAHPYISNSEFNELSFLSLKSIGDTGQFQVYDALMEKRPDGTPSMYDIPEYRQKIDAARAHAVSVFNTQHAAALKKAEDARQLRVDKSMSDVVNKALSGDPAGAMQDFVRMATAEGTEILPSERAQWQNTIEGLVVPKKETPAQYLKATEYLVKISRGEIKDTKAIYADAHSNVITWEKALALGNELDQRARAASQANRDSRDADLAKWNHPAVRQSEQNLMLWLNTKAELAGIGASDLTQLQGTVLHDFYTRVQSGKITPENALVEAEKLVDVYIDTHAKIKGGIASPATGKTPDPLSQPNPTIDRAREQAEVSKAPAESSETTRLRAGEFAFQSLLERSKDLDPEEFQREYSRLLELYPEYK